MPIALAIQLLLVLLAGSSVAADVTIRGERGAWTLDVDGEPFYVRGVTWGGGDYDEARWREDFEALKRLNANTIRTWGAGEETARLLDMADEYGIKVMLGLWLRHGRAGAEDDDEFDWIHDTEGRQAQWDKTMRAVEAFKDHTALLCWGVGNEVVLNIATEEERIAYARFLGQLTEAIKRADPHHPIASVSAWSIAWPYWRDYAPAIDIYGINTYGYGAGAIPGEQERHGIEKPYLICEFGATGEWETRADDNGVKLDPSEAQKFGIIADGWREMIESHAGHNLGGFVFHLGSKLDHAGLWLSFRCDGLWRPAYHGTMKAFADKLPDDRLPVVEHFGLSKDHGIAGEWVPVTLQATDPEDKPLRVRFMFNERRGERQHRDAVNPLQARRSAAGDWEIQLPTTVEPGGIKAYALVDDGVNLTIAQCSIKIER